MAAIVPVPFSENGGFLATTFFLFVPAQVTNTKTDYVGIFDTSSFDDPNNPSNYSWRAEDVVIGRYPVVRRAILVYTDLGLATITVTVTGTNDALNQVTASSTLAIGTSGATGQQFTAFANFQLACFRPQLSISRAAGGGPVSIVSASLIGDIEDVQL